VRFVIDTNQAGLAIAQAAQSGGVPTVARARAPRRQSQLVAPPGVAGPAIA